MCPRRKAHRGGVKQRREHSHLQKGWHPPGVIEKHAVQSRRDRWKVRLLRCSNCVGSLKFNSRSIICCSGECCSGESDLTSAVIMAGMQGMVPLHILEPASAHDTGEHTFPAPTHASRGQGRPSHLGWASSSVVRSTPGGRAPLPQQQTQKTSIK